jgi:hypothetical protein
MNSDGVVSTKRADAVTAARASRGRLERGADSIFPYILGALLLVAVGFWTEAVVLFLVIAVLEIMLTLILWIFGQAIPRRIIARNAEDKILAS